MNKEETIIFLEKEIEIYERLIKQEKRNIRNMINRSNVWIEDYEQTLSELKEELKGLKKD